MFFPDSDNRMPDTEFVFSSKLSLDEIRDILRSLIDSHIMLQTVQPIESYTEERNIDIT